MLRVIQPLLFSFIALVVLPPCAAQSVDDAAAAKNDPEKLPAQRPQPDDALRQAIAQAGDATSRHETTAPQLRFNFSKQPWGDVLRWLAEEARLQLQMDQVPPGTLSFIDPSRSYLPIEAVDLINRLLLDKGYALVRRGSLLIVVDLEDELAPKLIRELAESITADQLDQRGGSDIVRCVLALGGVSPETAEDELKQLIGPWGSVVVLESSRQAIVVETVEKLKAMREALRQANGPGGVGGDVAAIPLKHRSPDEVLAVAKQLMGLGEENSAEGIQIATDLFGANLFAAGQPAKLSQFRSIVELVDKPMAIDEATDARPVATPLLTRYPLTTVDSETAFNVLSTLLAGLPDVRMSIEPNSGSIILWARPDEQKLAAETIAMLEGKGTAFEVVQLNRLDPQSAVLTINKFFQRGEDGTGQGPTVDGDPTSGKLWIKGTPDQIKMVRELISQMEGKSDTGLLGDRVRLLPFTGRTAESAIQQLQTLWEVTGRKNKIRFATPSKAEPNRLPERTIKRPSDAAPEQKQTRQRVNSAFRLVSERNPTADEKSATAGADIVVSLTPGGLIIASDDVEALDQFESLLRALVDQTSAAGDTPTVFWLRFAKASEAATLLNNILSGGDVASGGGLTDLADDMLGELGGGMLGGLLGIGGSGRSGDDGPIFTTTGTVSIVADLRLNALIVQAGETDLQLVSDLLSVIDREESPEAVETQGKTYLIPIQHQDVNDVLTVCKSVFSDQMEQTGGVNKGGQPSPEDFINALRGGGRSKGRGGAGGEAADPPKMSLAVDAKNNILIVKGTPQHFQQVRRLVESLDIRGPNSEERVEVVSLAGSINPEVIQQALMAVLGEQATTGTTNGSTTPKTGSASTSSATQKSGSDNAAIQARRAAIFEQLRRSGAFGGGRPGGGGGGRPGDGGNDRPRGGGDRRQGR